MNRVLRSALLLEVSLAALVAGSAHAQTAAPAADTSDSGSVAQVVVTGSRLNAGFTAPTPVTVLGQAKIEQSAPSSVFDITAQIPAFRATQGPSESAQTLRTTGQAFLDLRGLNYPRTLVLIDGVRAAPNNPQNVFDTNMIPTGLVDHLDVVTGGASAAYGSDAISGVVNFVMKHKMEGVSGTLQYGISQHGDNKSPLISLALGLPFDGGRGHFEIGGDYNKNFGVNSIYDRSYGAREPGLVTLGATRPAGTPANIITYGAELSNNSGGGVISSGPLKGTAFDSNGQPYQLQLGPAAFVGATAMISNTNYGNVIQPGQQIVSPYNRTAIMARAEYDLTPDINVHASLSYGAVQAHSVGISFTPTDTIINVNTNPYVPAATKTAALAAGQSTIVLSKIATDYSSLLPVQSGNRQDRWEGVVGIDGKLGNDWKWSIDLDHGFTDSTRAILRDPILPNYYAAVNAVTNAQGQIVCGDLATNPNFPASNVTRLKSQVFPNCVPFNPFGLTAASAQSVAYIEGASDLAEMTRQDFVTANLSGDLFQLPAGPVSLAVGAEYRRNAYNSIAAYNSAPFLLFNENDISYGASVNSKELYGEAGVPLVKDKPLFKSLNLNGAIREIDYSTSGSVTTWKLGSTWDVNDDFRFRLSRSRDIRAANINELFNPGSNGSGIIVNNGTSAQVPSLSAGNPNLKPEVADTWTGGVAFQPTWAWARGFRATVDYFDITVNGVIATISGQDEVNRCNAGQTDYCQFLVRDSSAIGLSLIKSASLNLNSMKTSGFDIEVDYRVPFAQMGLPGDLNVRALGTRTNHLQVTAPLAAGGTVTTEYAGTYTVTSGAGSVSGGQPFWRLNGDITYTIGRFVANFNLTYTSRTKYSALFVGPDDPAYNATSATSINKNLLPASFYINPNFSYDFVRGDGHRLQGFVYINNLLNRAPPLGATLVNAGSPYDLVGRGFKFGLRFNY